VKIRFIKKRPKSFLPLIFVLLAGCATSPDKSEKPLSPPLPSPAVAESAKDPLPDFPQRNLPAARPKDPFSDLPERYRGVARQNEIGGDLPKALQAWGIVKGFIPDDGEAKMRISGLKKRIPAEADGHFRQGLKFFESHAYAQARKEFLFTLYLQPDHAEALRYLKEKKEGEDIFVYEVKKGDTIKGVARKLYKDPQKGFLIAYFNNLKIDSHIGPPLILRMPIVDSPQPKKTSVSAKIKANGHPEEAVDIHRVLEEAKSAYRAENYGESAALAEKALQDDPASKEGLELMNASYYQLGRQLGQEKKYRAAVEAFRRVDSGYKDVGIQLTQNRNQLAEAHYIKGVQFFIGEEIEKAIQEWETALTLEPKHPKARKDIENARNLLHKLEKVQ
jgi:tetratricopeptide (TPR) repeat protein